MCVCVCVCVCVSVRSCLFVIHYKICVFTLSVTCMLGEKQELIRERNDAVERLEGYVIDAEARSKE